jgi:hypothetical protein
MQVAGRQLGRNPKKPRKLHTGLTAATFGDEGSFTGAVFGDCAKFTSVTFGERANFTAAAFGNLASFVGAHLVTKPISSARPSES